MAKLTLKCACYQRYTGRLAGAETPLTTVNQVLGEHIGRNISSCVGGMTANDIAAHFMCSTIIDIPFSSGALMWPKLQAAIGAYTACPPETVVNAYECAAWGYALRYALERKLTTPYILCSIVDLNILDLSFWERNPNWGNSGFGIATLLFECEPEALSDVIVGVAKTSNSIAEFTIAMRETLKLRQGLKLAQPFFPSHVTELFFRLLPDADHLPDLHPRLGHCFGADPWLSILTDAPKSAPGQRYLAASVALNGYWALAEVGVDPTGVFSFTECAI